MVLDAEKGSCLALLQNPSASYCLWCYLLRYKDEKASNGQPPHPCRSWASFRVQLLVFRKCRVQFRCFFPVSVSMNFSVFFIWCITKIIPHLLRNKNGIWMSMPHIILYHEYLWCSAFTNRLFFAFYLIFTSIYLLMFLHGFYREGW